MADIVVDSKDFVDRVKKLLGVQDKAQKSAAMAIANEILRLSSFEVPHDKGELQNSGTVDPDFQGDVVVGYNKTYAHRLHEHPEYKFQKGRKGKFLEDPIKHNLNELNEHFGTNFKATIS